MKYIAHKREDGSEQLLLEHLEGTSRLCSAFAETFQQGVVGKYLGLFHDLGKYSEGFQNRILNNGPKVDHSTAGAQVIKFPLAAACIAGHHAGLLNYGSEFTEGTLQHRLKKHLEGKLDFSAWKNELNNDIPNLANELKKSGCKDTFSGMLLTRMLFSSLVDADFLDTEAFMTGNNSIRGSFDDIKTLYSAFEKYIAGFGTPSNELNKKRTEIRNKCLKIAEGNEGLYSLTVPTGGGKTIASLAFALKHAITHNKKRIIYVIPYTSIIEQTADVFRNIVGSKNVIEHHANVDYDKDETAAEKDIERFKLATENWDAPLIVTTNVQFFESLFSNRVSKCRKLHNIANSVVIFDEAQMLPTEYLLPCVKTIDELVARYKVTAVLCTATQPSLDSLFTNSKIKEICPDTEELYNFFRRVGYENNVFNDIEELSAKLDTYSQVLCIVNSKKKAQEVYNSLSGENCFHLSTFMCPNHRRAVLRQIRELLKNQEECKVIATSLVEAGVDLDFPVVYREVAGLDNIIQAAGRCNREGKQETSKSIVHIFKIDDDTKLPAFIRLPKEVTEIIQNEFDDIASVGAIKRYFDLLHTYKGEKLDAKNIIQNSDKSLPFKDIAEKFKLIEETGKSVFIALDEHGEQILNQLRLGIRNRELLRKAGQYIISVYDAQYDQLLGCGAIEKIDDNINVLMDMSFYRDDIGLKVDSENGIGVFI